MSRLCFLAFSLALAVACGGSARKVELAPLPAQPAAADAGPGPGKAAEAPAAPEPDPWAGRTDLMQPPAPAKPAAVNLAKIERFTLPNGLKVLVVASKDLPVVSMRLAISAGEQDEPRDKRLLALYAAKVLVRGTTKRNADEIAATMDFIGGDLSSNVDLESTYLSCSALARDLATCLTLLPEVTLTPTFPPAEMQQVSQQLMGGLKNIRDNPTALAREHLDNLIWGDDHVRGWPHTAEGVAAIKREDLIAWHKARFTPGNAMLAVAGDVDPKQLKTDLTRVFAAWKARPAPKTKVFKEPRPAGLRVRLVDKPDLTQAQIDIGHLGVAHDAKDYLPTVLMNYSLGGGDFSSRLNMAVRVKGGKTYDASSGYERWKTRGTFVAETGTRTSEAVATLKLVLAEMTRMRNGGPTAEELSAAKANVAGSYAARFEGAADVALAVLSAERHNLGEAWVREFPLRVDAVTLEQAKAAAAAHLDAENAAVVIVGKADEIAPQLEAAGLKFERVGYLEPVSRRDRDKAKPGAQAPVDPARTAAGKKLLDAALEAKGGADKLRGLKDLKTVGKVKMTLGKQQLEGDWTRILEVPDKLRLDVSVMGQTLQMTVTPQAVFQVVGGKERHDLPADLAAQAREGLWRDHDLVLLRHLDPTTIVQAEEKATAGGKSYDSVVIRRPDGSDETHILLDPATHRIFRLVYIEDGAPGIEEYSDYRQVEGLWMPYKQHAEGREQTFDVTVTEMLVNKGVAPDTFTHP